MVKVIRVKRVPVSEVWLLFEILVVFKKDLIIEAIESLIQFRQSSILLRIKANQWGNKSDFLKIQKMRKIYRFFVHSFKRNISKFI